VSNTPATAGRAVYEQLTAGVPLPLPPIPRLMLDVIAQGLVTAWLNVPQEQIRIADEAGLNAMMETQLNQLADQDNQFRMLVAAAVRGKETINFDGTWLEKRPDLSLILTDGLRARDFPLTIECKLIHRATKKGVTLYCNKGLKRFIDGDYGWARQEGLMLAYVRDDSTIDSQLRPHLARHFGKSDDIFCTEVFPLPIGASTNQAASKHLRRFRYPYRAPQDDPGPIAILHIWLDARGAD